MEIYNNPLHDGTDATFDTYELREVCQFTDETIEPVTGNGINPNIVARWWAIYGRTNGLGVEHLVDIDTRQAGLDTLRRMGVLKP